MTAQQQLVSILASRDETGHMPATAVDFISDHGPAIAELIEAARLVDAFPSEGRLNRLAAALRKLTQDA